MKPCLLALALILSSLLSAATWQTFTNTDHVYDVISSATDLYYSSWGGVINQLWRNGDLLPEAETINSGNGLVSNDVRCLAYINFSHSLWMGTSDRGVIIKSEAGLQQLTTELGLPSARVNRIIEHESTILVATAGGLAIFHYLEGVNFPLMMHQYTYENTNGGLLANNIQDLALANNGMLFVATSAGVCLVPLADIDNDNAWKSVNEAGLAIPGGSSIHLSVNESFLAVSVDYKAYRHPLDLANGDLEVFSTSNGLSGDPVSAIMLDEQNTRELLEILQKNHISAMCASPEVVHEAVIPLFANNIACRHDKNNVYDFSQIDDVLQLSMDSKLENYGCFDL